VSSNSRLTKPLKGTIAATILFPTMPTSHFGCMTSLQRTCLKDVVLAQDLIISVRQVSQYYRHYSFDHGIKSMNSEVTIGAIQWAGYIFLLSDYTSIRAHWELFPGRRWVAAHVFDDLTSMLVHAGSGECMIIPCLNQKCSFADSLSSVNSTSAYSNSDAKDYIMYLNHLRSIMEESTPPWVGDLRKGYWMSESVTCIVGE
jgi:hypothetical protein